MTGLTDEQVNARIAEGKVNADENPNTRTYKQIVRENTLTFFNFLNLVLLVLVLLVGSYKNAFFVCIIIINTLIGIAQEIRAKKTIDKLAILTARKSVVIREGQKWTVPTEELVLDDVVCLKTGDQVPADARILEGSLEVNESLLTGESDNLPKNEGDELFSGSFVTSGEACCQIIHVGKDNYAAQITSEAKEFKRHNSELKNSLNAILKVISIIIVPLGALLFYKQYYIVGDTFRDSVVSMVAGVLGMIPEGLVLLTSVALTLGALVLANKKTLVQELYCIETLARVDTLCLDKTGTITEGTMCVERVEPYVGTGRVETAVTESEPAESTEAEAQVQTDSAFMDDINNVMGNMMYVLKDQNATIDALRKRFPAKQGMTLEHVIPFSSDRKYSGAVFEEKGTYLMGAAQFLFPEDRAGKRIIAGKKQVADSAVSLESEIKLHPRKHGKLKLPDSADFQPLRNDICNSQSFQQHGFEFRPVSVDRQKFTGWLFFRINDHHHIRRGIIAGKQNRGFSEQQGIHFPGHGNPVQTPHVINPVRRMFRFPFQCRQQQSDGGNQQNACKNLHPANRRKTVKKTFLFLHTKLQFYLHSTEYTVNQFEQNGPQQHDKDAGNDQQQHGKRNLHGCGLRLLLCSEQSPPAQVRGKNRQRITDAGSRLKRLCQSHDQPRYARRQADFPTGVEQNAQSRRDAFSAFELQPNRKVVSQNARRAGNQSRRVANAFFGNAIRRDERRQSRFARIQYQRQQSQILASRAQNIRRADVARTDFADVAQSRHAGQHNPERNRTQHIADDGGKD